MSKQEAILRESSANMLESIAVASTLQRPVAVASPAAAKLQGVTRLRNAVELTLERLVHDPDQPRQNFPEKELDELAASLKDQGQLQPILVRWVEELSHYKVIAGNRRFFAAQKAELKTLQCIVVERDLTTAELRIIQLVENVQRQDLNPLEKARAMKQLMQDHGYSLRDLARVLHLDPGTVSTTLDLLELPADIQEQVLSGALPATTASELAKLDDESDQRKLAHRVVTEKLSRDAVRKVTRKPRTDDKDSEQEKPKGTTICFRLSRGTVAVTPHRKDFRKEDLLSLLEEAATSVRLELEMKKPAA